MEADDMITGSVDQGHAPTRAEGVSDVSLPKKNMGEVISEQMLMTAFELIVGFCCSRTSDPLY